MIRLLKIIILILGSVILQTTLIARITIFGSKPDLPLALIVSVALFRGSISGEITGFVSGLLCDTFSGGPLGAQAFSGVVIGYLIGFVRRRFYYDNLITQSICGFIATLGSRTIISVYLALFFNSRFLHIRFQGLMLTAVLNSVFVIGISWVVKKFIVTDN